MAQRFGEYLDQLGVAFQERDANAGAASTDMGDVSYAVPSIHPYMAICDIGESMCHQDTFVECANRPCGYQTMLNAAKAIALTACDLLTRPDFLAATKAEWAQSRRAL
jgi:metal-dependent amidase/aminoacylase/carboxypeptidase family protein